VCLGQIKFATPIAKTHSPNTIVEISDISVCYGARRVNWPLHMISNDRVERPATMTVPRPDAAHHATRSARTRC
jgi:hypothetical protein